MLSWRPVYIMCSYISSASTNISSWLFITRASPSSSAFEYTLPVGLLGEQSMSRRVFGVMAASSCSGVILKFCSKPAFTITGTPPASLAICGYDTQYGAGIITSSPSLTRAMTVLHTLCLAPFDTSISFTP